MREQASRGWAVENDLPAGEVLHWWSRIYEKCSGYAGDSEPAKENVCPVGKDDGQRQATRHHTTQQKNSH